MGRCGLFRVLVTTYFSDVGTSGAIFQRLLFLLCTFNVLSVVFNGMFSEASVDEAKKQTKK